MNSIDRQAYFDELLELHVWGSTLLSAWTEKLTIDAQLAFISGAYLATILVSQACIESHLRYDVIRNSSPRWGFYDLIENSSLDSRLKRQLHELRSIRNKWVHVNDPENDDALRARPQYYHHRMEKAACKAVKLMLIILHLNQNV